MTTKIHMELYKRKNVCDILGTRNILQQESFKKTKIAFLFFTFSQKYHYTI